MSSNKGKACVTGLERAMLTHRHREHWFSSAVALENLHNLASKPLFRCEGCSVRIERSMATYWRNKGKLLCSSCLDRQEMLLKTGEGDGNTGTSEFRGNSSKS